MIQEIADLNDRVGKSSPLDSILVGAFVRYFSKINGSVHFPHAVAMGVDGPEVMFQKIIYDGLVGHYFLREFTVTYNLPNSEMIFRRP
jgi:hypothetical protein